MRSGRGVFQHLHCWRSGPVGQQQRTGMGQVKRCGALSGCVLSLGRVGLKERGKCMEGERARLSKARNFSFWWRFCVGRRNRSKVSSVSR